MDRPRTTLLIVGSNGFIAFILEPFFRIAKDLFSSYSDLFLYGEQSLIAGIRIVDEAGYVRV